MKKVGFNVLNAVIILVLILFTAFYFYSELRTTATINNYKNEINQQQSYITTLKQENVKIDSEINLLNDSISSLKYKSALYEDSLSQINNHYEKAVEEVRALSDSLTVVRFRRITSEHAERLGYDLN